MHTSASYSGPPRSVAGRPAPRPRAFAWRGGAAARFLAGLAAGAALTAGAQPASAGAGVVDTLTFNTARNASFRNIAHWTPLTSQKKAHGSLFSNGFAVTNGIPVPGQTWTGGGASGNWSDSNNWGGAQPAYGTLTFSGSTRTTNTDDNITSMNQLLWTGTSAWTLNQGGATVLSLFDNGGTQAKVENQSTGLVTINLPITFAATTGAAWGEINAVNGGLTFGTGTLTVNGSQVNGIKLFGGGQTTTFNNTVSATGKYFATTSVGDTIAIGGTFTSGDFYLMNNGILNLSGSGFTTTALRLGGDFGTTGSQDQTKGATFNLVTATGGQTFSSTINPVSGNTSGALAINSQNTSGTNTLGGGFFLDTASQNSGVTPSLTVTQSGTGGTLLIGAAASANTVSFQNASNRTLALNATAATSNITVNEAFANVLDGTDLLIMTGAGTTTINSDNSASTSNLLRFNPVGGTLAISNANNLGSPVVASTGYPDKVLFGGPGAGTTSSLLINGTFSYGSATAGSLLGLAVNKGTSANTAVINVSGANTLTMNGALSDFASGAGSVVGNWQKAGTGTLILNAASAYGGSTTISAGTLKAGNTSAIPSASAVTLANVAGATLDITGFNNSIGSLTGGGSTGGTVTLGAATLTVGGNNTSPAAYAGTMSGTGTLNKTGSGTLTLGGNGTSTAGGIQVNGGTLTYGIAGTDAPNYTVATNNPGVFVISGNMNVANGMLTATASQGFVLNGTNTYTQTGGAFSTNGIIEFANGGGSSTVNISGGTLTTTSANGNDATDLAVRGTTTVNLTGGTFTTPVLNMNTSQLSGGAATSTFNLNGGTLAVGRTIPGTNGTGTFNFNGGTLMSTASSGAFMTGLTNAFVKSGGAVIDTRHLPRHHRPEPVDRRGLHRRRLHQKQRGHSYPFRHEHLHGRDNRQCGHADGRRARAAWGVELMRGQLPMQAHSFTTARSPRP